MASSIRPYINSSIEIKNLYTYHNFLRRRPSKAKMLKFSMTQFPERPPKVDEKQLRRKLLTTMKIIKPPPKIDLGGCDLKNSNLWQTQLLLILKKISRAKTLRVMDPRTNSSIRYFKSFVKLKHLIYQLVASLDSRGSLTHHNFLEYLKYCPKINALAFTEFTGDLNFTKTGSKSKRYLSSLEHLTIKSLKLDGSQTDFPIEYCPNLKSISLRSYDLHSQKLARILNALLKLPNLQEISLGFRMNPMDDLFETFQKITSKGILTKFDIDFGSDCDTLHKNPIAIILEETIKLCKLRYFSLKAYFQSGLFKSISEMIQRMKNLEHFELHIRNQNLFKKDDGFVEVYKQINKLQALKSLKMQFKTEAKSSKFTIIPSPFAELADVFRKPIRIQTFHIGCNQLSPSEAFNSLMTLLKDSASFLTHLRIDFGSLPCSRKTCRTILALMKNLTNIQVLKIPCLVINESISQFLNEITTAVYALKYLRVFSIGKIKNTVIPTDLFSAFMGIASKKGLREFSFSMRLQNDLLKETRKLFNSLDQVIESNPSLEKIKLKDEMLDLNIDICQTKPYV